MNDMIFNQIESFLDDELTGGQLKEFKKELRENRDLQKELKLHRGVNEAIMEKDIMDLRRKLEDIKGTSYWAISKKLKFLVKYKLAATIALLLGFGFLMRQICYESIFSNEKMIGEYYEPYNISTSPRSADVSFDNLLAEVLKDYDAEDCKEVLDLFEQILERDSSSAASYYLLKYSKFHNLPLGYEQ